MGALRSAIEYIENAKSTNGAYVKKDTGTATVRTKALGGTGTSSSTFDKGVISVHGIQAQEVGVNTNTSVNSKYRGR